MCNDYCNVCDMFEIYYYPIFQTHYKHLLFYPQWVPTQLAFFMISVNNHGENIIILLMLVYLPNYEDSGEGNDDND